MLIRMLKNIIIGILSVIIIVATLVFMVVAGSLYLCIVAPSGLVIKALDDKN